MESKLFSVIIPVYNCAPYISRSAESVLKQSYPALELILVDDGSEDGSGEICNRYAQRYENCKVIHQENRGPSAARNTGLEYASGDYVCFLDADDYFEKDLLTRVAEELNLGADICSFGARRVDEEGNYLWEMRFAAGIGRVELKESDRRLFLFTSFLQYEIGWEVWLQVFRRDLLEKYKIRFDERIHYGEDKIFTAHCLSYAGRIVKLPDILYNYTVRKGALTEQFSQENLMNQGNCEFTYLQPLWEKSGVVNEKEDYLVYIGILYYYYTIFLKTKSLKQLKDCAEKSEQLQLQTQQLKKVLRHKKEIRAAFGQKMSEEIRKLAAVLSDR